MSNDALYNAQKLLYIWLSKFDRRSLVQIKDNCNYLNVQYELQLTNPTWSIFWPLVFNGQVDHVVDSYYALTEPLVIDYGDHYVYINHNPQSGSVTSDLVGLYISNSKENNQDIKSVHFDAVSVLKHFPSIDSVVDNFPTTLQDESNLRYLNYHTKKGVAELEAEGLTRYFSIPEKLYIREIPSSNINPEAFAIAYCYGRVVNNEYNGIFNGKNNQLKMPSFGMPFMLYRVLLLECLKYNEIPVKEENTYIFNNISPKIIQQLKRILCNSIKYE